MNDKQIMVDNVDVSGCRYLFDDTSYKRSKTSCSITLKDCKYLGNDCYYKQLQRLKEEINKLHRKLYCYAMDKECKDGTVECKQKNCAIKLYPKYKSALDEIENVLSWIDNSNLWYNGQKVYMGDELIEFLKSRIINIINSTKAEKE